jgi:aryl-alcohol dehydrogenase-like predicted oxidoreductase
MRQTASPLTHTLGASDVSVPPLGIGTWQWGDTLFWGYGKGGYTDDDLRAAFDAALAAGISFFDTAEVYGRGQSERLLGEFARSTERPLTVATKFMPYPWRLRQPSLVSALRASLKRLALARVDLYQVHWPMPLWPVETWSNSLADAVDAGLTRAVGVSNYGVDQMRRAHEALARRGVPLASNQVEYSLLQRKPERSGLLAACRELNVALIAYSPLAQGLLTGKYTPENPPPGVRGRRYAGRLARTEALISLARRIGEDHGGKNPTQVALNWLVAKGAVPIPGVKRARHVEEIVGALGWSLTSDEIAALDEATDRRA